MPNKMKPINPDDYLNLVYYDVGMVDGTTKNGNKKRYREIVILCPDCNNKFQTRANMAKNKLLRCSSCANSRNSSKHNNSLEKLYKVWVNMKSRCNNPNHHKYQNYGGRGISVCDEWTKSFVSFRDWSIINWYIESNGCHKNKMSIDRIDNDGNYEPDNCQWITVSENTAKRYNNKPAKENNLIKE